MKRNKLKIVIALIPIVVIGLFIFFKIYNKPHVNVNKATAEVTITADNMLSDYQNDELMANEKYVDKVVQIRGIISNISFENGNSIITLKDPDQSSSIICHMLPEENLSVLNLKKESQINIKGICTGYLLDVMMVRCVLVN